jgi:hypothetical protein
VAQPRPSAVRGARHAAVWHSVAPTVQRVAARGKRAVRRARAAEAVATAALAEVAPLATVVMTAVWYVC